MEVEITEVWAVVAHQTATLPIKNQPAIQLIFSELLFPENELMKSGILNCKVEANKLSDGFSIVFKLEILGWSAECSKGRVCDIRISSQLLNKLVVDNSGGSDGLSGQVTNVSHHFIDFYRGNHCGNHQRIT